MLYSQKTKTDKYRKSSKSFLNKIYTLLTVTITRKLLKSYQFIGIVPFWLLQQEKLLSNFNGKFPLMIFTSILWEFCSERRKCLQKCSNQINSLITSKNELWKFSMDSLFSRMFYSKKAKKRKKHWKYRKTIENYLNGKKHSLLTATIPKKMLKRYQCVISIPFWL